MVFHMKFVIVRWSFSNNFTLVSVFNTLERYFFFSFFFLFLTFIGSEVLCQTFLQTYFM